MPMHENAFLWVTSIPCLINDQKQLWSVNCTSTTIDPRGKSTHVTATLLPSMTMKRLLDASIFCSAIKGWGAGTWKRGSIESFCRLLAAFGGLWRLKFWPFWFGLSNRVKRWPLKTALFLFLSWPFLNRWFSVSIDKFSMARFFIAFFATWFLLDLDFFFFDLETRENPTSRCLWLSSRFLADRSSSSNSSVLKDR